MTTTITSSAATAAAWSTSIVRSATPHAWTASDDAGFEIDEAEVVYWAQVPCPPPGEFDLTITSRGSLNNHGRMRPATTSTYREQERDRSV